MSETPFPKVLDTMDCGEYRYYIMDWFERCKADFPEGEQITHGPVQSLVFYQWFEKWFSQFEEMKDER